MSETLAESLADLYDVVRPGTPAAAHFRAAADRERAWGRTDVDDLTDEIRALFHGIGEPSARAKHDDMPCLKHVECVAAAVEAVLSGCDV